MSKPEFGYTWTIVKTGTSPEELESGNSVFTVSNGYLSLKGNLLERHEGRCPTTIVAGVFDQLDMIKTIPPSGRERRWLHAALFDDPKPCPSVANLPDPLFLRAFINGCELSFDRGTVSGFRQECHLATGLYSYEYDLTPEDGPTFHIHAERFASMVHPHAAGMRYSITPVNYTGPIQVRSGVDGSVHSNLLPERQFAVDYAEGIGLHAHLRAGETTVEVLTDTIAVTPPESVTRVAEHDRVYQEFTFNARPDEAITLEKFIVVATSEDERHGVACDAAAELAALVEFGYDAALAEHVEWWKETWGRVDVEIDGDDAAQRDLRFCLYQLVCAAPRHTDSLSVPCKLLTGEWYQGSVFYDTDLCILPFYTFAMPDVAKGCLNYRYQGLEHGCAIARQFGYAGAKFAWQSGPYGEEVLAPWYRFVHSNIHINADVCYALDLYRKATGDTAFMREKGIDILVETARFYASRAVRDGDAYHLKDVSGPDEGHCESTDNFYTNVLAAKTLRWAAETLDQLSSESPGHAVAAKSRLNVGEGEPEAWRRVANGLALLFDAETKVYEQYDGYHALKPIPPKFRDGQKEWWFSVFTYQAIHQPDVVMAMVMLREDFPDDVFRANRAFYRERSMDFSSMSHVIHSLAASDVGNGEDAYQQFMVTAGEDLDEALTGRYDTADGLHGTATGGAWMAAVFGFGGVRLTEKCLTVNPHLPAHWTALRFNIWLRGERLRFDLTHGGVRINVGSEAALEMPAMVCGQETTLKSGETYNSMSS